MPKTGRAKNIQPTTRREKKDLLGSSTKNLVTRVGISRPGGRSQSRVQSTRLQEQWGTNFLLACETLFRLATDFAVQQFLVVVPASFESLAKTLFAISRSEERRVG